jgi:serine/threonine protein kinase
MKAKSRYEIKGELARGGMGVVYRAHDKLMNRQVALKTLYDVSDPKATSMFQREWQDLASLTHPNIVEVLDIGELEIDGENRPYLVMPLLPGSTLDQLIKSGSQRLTVERSIDIILQTARGLQAAHDRGIVHRDLKPSNVFVMPDDSVKIIDFGVAGRLDKTKTIGAKGTLLYMSPEQLENKPVTAVSDIFSLAIVCYETLTRKRPFERPTEEEVVEAILRWTPPPVFELNPAVSVIISKVVQKGMAKQPWHRFASAKEFSETLQKALRNEPIESLNPAKIEGRMQRAREVFQQGDFVLAGEILGELEAEGHFDADIAALKDQVARALTDTEINKLLESARVREQHQEFPLALQKIHEILQLNPHHTEALAIKSRIDSRRTEADIEEWLRVSHQHLDNFAYSHAREALQRVLQLRPREPRALQMLAEADRREQEYIRLRQEKESLYRAAVAHAQNGEISQALSKAERVLDLDKQAPELMDASRTTSYHSFYNRVRSESEAFKSAYEQARAQLANRNHAAALAICQEQLARNPHYDAFLALRLEIEEQRRKALSARIAEVDGAVDAEPDLNRRIGILEEAANEFPGEPHFQHALQLARHKLGLVESIVSRARTHEEQGQFGEAITQWETLETIHKGYPGIALELERLRKRRVQQERQERKRRWVEQIERHLERKDFVAAHDTVKSAIEDFPDDAELVELGKTAERGLERWGEARKLFIAGREAYDGQRLEQATTLLRRAMELDDCEPGIRSLLMETLVRRAQLAHEQEPAAAEALLREALDIEPNHALAKGLLNAIEDERRVELIERCLSRARQLQNENDLPGALKEVEEALQRFPDEDRLDQLRMTLEKALREARRHDIDEARRIERDVESVNDPKTAQEYARRLDTIVTRYEDDAEVRSIATVARQRLESKSPGTTQTIKAATPRPPKNGAASTAIWRSPWVIGGATCLALIALLLPFVLHRRPPQPQPAVQTASVPEPAPAPPPPAAPEMDALMILGSGKLSIDGGPQEDLENLYSKDFPLDGAEHKIEANAGPSGVLSFSFTANAGQPASVKIDKSRDILAFLVSTSNGKRTLYSSRKLGDLKIDGTSVGSIGPEGLALPDNLDTSEHKLEWMEGAEAKSREIRFESSRGLLVQLDSDPNVGTVVVKLNVPVPVDISVRLQNGKEIEHAAGVTGQWGPAHLHAGSYTIEASPRQGYEKATLQATVKKNAEQNLAMDFKKVITSAHMLITTAPHAHILLNGAAQGDADDSGRFAFQSLPPGHYQFIARLNGYRDAEVERDLGAGANETVSLTLARAAGTIVVQKDPASAAVYWTRAGDFHWEAFDGASKEFPEGEYSLRAQAEGFNEITTGPISVQAGRSITVPLHLTARVTRTVNTKAAPANFCANWPDGVTDKVGCQIKATTAYAQVISNGVIDFKAWSPDDHGLRWQVGYRDEKNYWEFELTKKTLKVWEVAKKRSEKLNIPVHIDMAQWHEALITVKGNELRLQIPDANVDKAFGDPQTGFSGMFRVEVRKQPVWVMLAQRP